MPRTILIFAALNGFLVVVLGAFGAHGIQHRISPELYSVFQTGVQYHGLHVPALLAVGLLSLHYPSPTLVWSARLFLIGILLFSGSLYLLTLTESRLFGAVTPVGGLTLLAGWLALCLHAWQLRPEPDAG